MTTTDTLDGGPLPIDLEHLSQYTANDPDVTRDILRLFREQMDIRMEALRAPVDLASWREETHALKGSALGIGAQELVDAVLEGEALAELEGEAYTAVMSRIEHAATRASQYACQLLEDGGFAG